MTAETRQMLRQIAVGSCVKIDDCENCPMSVENCDGNYYNLPAPIRAKAAAMLEEATTETDNKMRIGAWIICQ